MSKCWYSVRAQAPRAEGEKAENAEVFIYGDIGESWWDETVTARQFVKDIAALDVKRLTVRINSVGGSVPDGLAIYNALRRHPAQITTTVDGMAMSIASLIAMAGDTVEMAENAILMIHAPWTYAAGNAAELRDRADILDKWAAAMASSYATKSGKSDDDILSLLTDGVDHYYTATEAQAEGFADTVVAAFPIAASAAIPATALARYPSAAAQQLSNSPAAAAANPQEQTMPQATPTPAADPNTADITAKARAEALAAEKTRRETVRAEFAPFMARGIAGLDDIQAACLDDHAITPEAACKRILEHMAKDATPVGATHVETVEDETDKRREGIVSALLARAGVADAKTKEAAKASAFRGHRLLDLARASLQAGGIRHDRMDPMQIVAAAFTQSASDFPVLLENAMHKALQSAYLTAADTWSRFCATGSVSDFRAHNRYRVGSLGNLQGLNELGEFKNKTIPDGEKGTITAGTKGNIINLSRQAIINDDLNAFIGLAAQLGRAARRTIEADVYALLAENAGLGPTMLDGKTLFHADHGNIGTGSVISVEGLDADRVKMASQTDVGGNEFLDLRPDVLLVPLGLGGTARVINQAEYDPDTSGKLQRPNMVAGLFSDIVDTPRLTGTRRYLFADPAAAPVIEVAFLDGNDVPYVEAEAGFTVDGTRWKVRLDYGVGAVDYRGAVTNAGTT